METKSVEIAEIRKRVQAILEGNKVQEETAALVADSLLDAEIRGVTSHGLMRLQSYVERIQKGLVAAVPEIQISGEGSLLTVDGGNGLGQEIAAKALEACMEQAEKLGAAAAAIRRSNHFGTAGYFSRLAAKKGYVAFVASNASPTMPPFGGIDPLLGTNPFAVSFPAGKYDNFTIDIAMSATAKGKIRIYEKEGREIPLGWAMDADGMDTTNPTAAIAGGLLPMGGHKGYGMAMVVDLLCGLLSGANLSCETESMFDASKEAGIGHYIYILKIDALMPKAAFEKRAEEWFDRLKASRLRPGTKEILIPGELENKRAKEIDGTLEISKAVWEWIKNFQTANT